MKTEARPLIDVLVKNPPQVVEIAAAKGIWAVFYCGQPCLQIRRGRHNDYVRMTFNTKNMAITAAENLNELFKTTLFTAHEMIDQSPPLTKRKR